jgi:beta-lactam-binding protein with PASTA domain
MLRTGTLALAALIAALFMGGASAHAAAEAPPSNDDVAAARKAIMKARCLVGRVSRSWSARAAKGHVIRQRAAPRTRLASRSRVHLVVCKGRRR